MIALHAVHGYHRSPGHWWRYTRGGMRQAAAAAGYETLLVEQNSLAGGTSSKSSKLIHGGLRYLEHGEFRLVAESLRERELLLRLAPTLVHRRRFLLPIYRGNRRPAWMIRCGLALYTAFAGFRQGTWPFRVRRSDWHSLDGLNTDGLQAVLGYTDAQTDDRRLTRAVMRSAESLGARQVCPAQVTEVSLENDHCRVRLANATSVHGPLADAADRMVRSQVVINAAGPWCNQLLLCVRPPQRLAAVELVQGTHLELSGTVEAGGYYLEVPADGRGLFVLPWQGRTLVGTTETIYDGRPEDSAPRAEEVAYLMQAFSHFFPRRSQQVVAAWSGLRVLPAADRHRAAFRRSRETQLLADRSPRPRLVSICGGKLTTYRATAERVIGLLKSSLPPRQPRARTRDLPLRDE